MFSMSLDLFRPNNNAAIASTTSVANTYSTKYQALALTTSSSSSSTLRSDINSDIDIDQGSWLSLHPPKGLHMLSFKSQGSVINAEPIMPSDQFFGQEPGSSNYLDVCRGNLSIFYKQRAEKPVTFASPGKKMFVGKESGKSIQMLPDVSKGNKLIDEYLASGKPIIVGVNHTYGNKYNEGSTDHFVIIVGKGKDAIGTYYRFYDEGTKRAAGTSENNKLYLQDDGRLTGKTEYNKKLNYTVTQIRPN